MPSHEWCTSKGAGAPEALEHYCVVWQPVVAVAFQQVSHSCLHLLTRLQVSCRKGAGYVVRGHKWWASGAMDPRCAISIFMGKTDPQAETYRQQSMILVPMDAPGVCIIRPLDVFGYDDAPHGHAEVMFEVW